MNPEIRDQAYQFFIEEASELLQVIESRLLTLKEERSIAKVHEMMRAAHSLKGGAASVDLETIRTLAHRLEDFFKAFYHDEVVIDTELESLLLQGFDCLKNPLSEQIERGYFDPEAAITLAQPIFIQLEARLGSVLSGCEDYLPSSADLGIDMTTTLFEIDVNQELERLSMTISSAQADIAIQLRTTIDIFAGFAELLNLPGWAEIGQTAIASLTRHPQHARKIAQLALADWQVGRELVLSGQPQKAMPSPELLTFGTSSEVNPKLIDDNAEDTLRAQAYQFFIEEATELLQIIEKGLWSLREDRSQNKVHEIMRAAHSIKGGAASVGLEAIRVLASHLENYFKVLHRDDVYLDDALEGLLLQGYDCLKTTLFQQIEVGQTDANALAIAQPIFEQIENTLGDVLHQNEDYLPSSADLGIDIVASIFEIDVAQGLETLVLAYQNPNTLTQSVENTLEVFEGFAQMLSLPGFAAICQTVRTAMAVSPQHIEQITELALQNFQQAREQILTGDRIRGGEPSLELLALTFSTEPEPDLSQILNPETEFPALDAIFGQQSPEIFDNLPSLDEVFGLSNEEISPPPFSNTLPDLDEVFGSVEFSSATPSILDEVFGSAQLSPTIPSLEEVFAVPEESLSPFLSFEDRQDAYPTPPLTPSLEEVFAVSEESLPLPLSFEDRQDAYSTPPLTLSLEEIFNTTEIASTESLEETMEAIQKNFEQLPPAQPFPKTRPSSTPKEPPSPDTALKSSFTKAAKPDTVATPALSVRVDFNRLERMNNVVGEFAINRNSLSLQNEQLQAAVKELLNRFRRFETMTLKLRELSDQMLIAPMKDLSRELKSNVVNNESTSEFNFDALEMDRYGKLYSLLQGLLEEMMQLEESVDDIVLFARGSNQTLETQRQMLTSLRDELMWARMLPLSEVLNRFPRLLRDLSAAYSKLVRLKLTGTSVLVDKAALEKLYDPLLHLLRNAFDHGIESPKVRQEKGKPEEGLIEIHAYHQGNQTIIEVRDDGQGLNLDKITQKALKMGLVTPEQLAVMTRERIADLVFEPTFSTAEKVSELSGRGVGLDVVREQLHSLKGTVTVTSVPEQGTTFTMRLPLTLTIGKLLVCLIHSSSSHKTAVALPSDSIEEIVIPQAEQIKKSGQQRFLHFAQQIIPIYSLGDLLDYRCPIPEIFSSKALEGSVPLPEDWGLPLLLLRRGQQLYAVEVSRLVTEQELVIKPFGVAIAAPSYTYGCTILGDGTLIPVINGIILLEQSLEMGGTTATPTLESVELQTIEAKSVAAMPTILVVDDSVALRRTLALTLQKCGYRVLQARDGREALEQLHQSSGIKLVICDVEMPNMNGFEFLGQRRREPELMTIPVAMLTSRSSDKHRHLAMHLGASDYFTKPYIEQQFLSAVQNLINQSVGARG